MYQNALRQHMSCTLNTGVHSEFTRSGRQVYLTRRVFSIMLVICLMLPLAGVVNAGSILIDHTAVAAFDSIPQSYIELAQSEFRMLYGHRSHGSQLLTGQEMILAEDPTLIPPPLDEILGVIKDAADTSWLTNTRAFLDDTANSDVNSVMWAWTGGVVGYPEDAVHLYLAQMAQLEIDYPHVTFVYMTDHMVDWAPITSMYRNDLIRAHCQQNDRVLYDFHDIESHDPNGDYYPDDGQDCDWCVEWCSTHECPTCDECAHSHCFNCYQKGKAFWTLMARLVGWGGPGIGPPHLVDWVEAP